ncbi:unnamed protein product [Calicophoron daubneyi]|uniref:Uncharacterized protein n=1 Tax=Calicophoron daubneyi TaxID=300641 RepID=A0AAV2TBB4_CALDB
MIVTEPAVFMCPHPPPASQRKASTCAISSPISRSAIFHMVLFLSVLLFTSAVIWKFRYSGAQTVINHYCLFRNIQTHQLIFYLTHLSRPFVVLIDVVLSFPPSLDFNLSLLAFI